MNCIVLDRSSFLMLIRGGGLNLAASTGFLSGKLH